MHAVLTKDGSYTLNDPVSGENYHSHHGAVSESLHVFIRNGLLSLKDFSGTCRILEVGLGTGLNVLLSCLNNPFPVEYEAIEPHPIPAEALKALISRGNPLLPPEAGMIWAGIMKTPPEQSYSAGYNFLFCWHQTDLLNFFSEKKFHLVYYDAFSPLHAPHMWTEEMFRHLTQFLEPDAVLVTYSCTGKVKRILQSLGFEVQRLKGPPHKKHMLRAIYRGAVSASESPAERPVHHP